MQLKISPTAILVSNIFDRRFCFVRKEVKALFRFIVRTIFNSHYLFLQIFRTAGAEGHPLTLLPSHFPPSHFLAFAFALYNCQPLLSTSLSSSHLPIFSFIRLCPKGQLRLITDHFSFSFSRYRLCLKTAKCD